MKKPVLMLIIGLAVLFFVAPNLQVDSCRGDINTTGTNPNSGIVFTSPHNETYTSRFLTLNASTSCLAGRNVEYTVKYCLDGKSSMHVPFESRQQHSWDPFFGTLVASVDLPELTDGPHYVTIYVSYTIERSPSGRDQNTVYFTIANATASPTPTQPPLSTPSPSPTVKPTPAATCTSNMTAAPSAVPSPSNGSAQQLTLSSSPIPTTAVPEFPTWAVVVAGLTLTVLAYKKTIRRK